MRSWSGRIPSYPGGNPGANERQFRISLTLSHSLTLSTSLSLHLFLTPFLSLSRSLVLSMSHSLTLVLFLFRHFEFSSRHAGSAVQIHALWSRERALAHDNASPVLSDIMYLLFSFRKSNPAQNRQLHILISNSKQ